MNQATDMTFGRRVAYDQSALTDGGTHFSQFAHTDGLVMAVVGQPTLTENYLGTLEGSTIDAQGATTSFVYATGFAYLYPISSGKKSMTQVNVPVPGAFTMPVRRGETWVLELTWNAQIGPAPRIEFYWIPTRHAEHSEVPVPAHSEMARAMGVLRDDLRSGKAQSTMLASAQQAIDTRVNDLAQILSDTTNPDVSEETRQQFVRSLRTIVCSPLASEAPAAGSIAAADIQDLVASFGRLADRALTPAQGTLIDNGIRALVQINENSANRVDLQLIDRNIGLFLDNVQTALDLHFSPSQRRLLTRALMRLVGDGTQGDR